MALWNGLDGLAPVKKFTSRKVAVQRLWKALQALEPERGPEARRKGRNAAEAAPAAKDAATARAGSKKSAILELLGRPEGATLDELMERTGWLPHSVRGFLSTLRKEMALERVRRSDGQGVYRLQA